MQLAKPTQPIAYRLLMLGVMAGYAVYGALLVFVLHSHGYPLSYFSIGIGGDAWEYNRLGLSLLNHHVFSLGALPEYFRTPGYPFILALLYGLTHSLYGVVAFQVVLVALSAYLIAKMGEELGSSKAGIVAGVLYALDPTVFIGALMTLSDVLFAAVLLVLCYVSMKPRTVWLWEALFVGAGTGFLTLVRPTGLFVLPVLCAWFVIARYRTAQSAFLQASLLLLLCAIVLVPWSLRNYQLAQEFSISSVAPYNFLFYNIAEYEVARGDGTKDAVHAALTAKVGTDDTAVLRDLHMTGTLRAVAKEELAGNVTRYALFHIEKTIPFYIGSSIQAVKRALGLQGVLPGLQSSSSNISSLILSGHVADALSVLIASPWELLERVFWLLVLGLDVLALFLARGRARILLIFFAIIALLFGGLTGPVSFPRYRMPAEPFLLLSAAYAVAVLARMWGMRGAWLGKARRLPHVREFLRYFSASLLALASDAGSLYVMVTLGVNYLYAGALAFLIGLLVIYLLSVIWVFEKRSAHSVWVEFALFSLIGLLGLGMNELVLWLGTGILALPLFLSKGLSVLLVFTWNYSARKYILFRA